MNFEELKIQPELVRALKEMSIVEPTEVQEKAIPLILDRKDVVGMSHTGSGKTAAFGVPVIQNIKPGIRGQVLIVSPTRELAVQISNEMKKFGKYMKFNVATIFGGVALNPQIDELDNSEIIVGTPGRLLDHCNRKTMDLSRVDCVVLDEADKMVEMGFIEDIVQLLDQTSKGRQVLLFGATISTEINRLKAQYMNSPVEVHAKSQVQGEQLKQYYYNVLQHEKFSLLVHLLKKEKIDRAIIFCSTRSTVELVAKNLKLQGFKSELLHGKLTQNRRLNALDNFHNGKRDILVASAVAARGLDIKDVTHVFNYDLSQDSQEYVHRVGRTARAGETGKAITLLSQADHDTFRNVLAHHKMKVEELKAENFQKVRFDTGRDRERRGSPRFGHSRGGSRPKHHHESSGGSRSSYGSGSRGGYRSGGSSPKRNSQSSGNVEYAKHEGPAY